MSNCIGRKICPLRLTPHHVFKVHVFTPPLGHPIMCTLYMTQFNTLIDRPWAFNDPNNVYMVCASPRAPRASRMPATLYRVRLEGNMHTAPDTYLAQASKTPLQPLNYPLRSIQDTRRPLIFDDPNDIYMVHAVFLQPSVHHMRLGCPAPFIIR